jgi:hypothetical protein
LPFFVAFETVDAKNSLDRIERDFHGRFAPTLGNQAINLFFGIYA